MKAIIIVDKDYQIGLFNKLHKLIVTFLNNQGIETELVLIGRNDLAFCRGCFGCWIKKPGECIYNDMMSQINRNTVNIDVVVYLSPIIFGQFSANIKNALDRWIPNVLPFLETRSDGSTMHPLRYDSYPRIIIIGYGNDLLAEDIQLFTDITKKHRKNSEVIIYQGDDLDITDALKKIKFGMVGVK